MNENREEKSESLLPSHCRRRIYQKFRLILALMAPLAFLLISAPVKAQFSPGIYTEFHGLDFKNDKFDELIVQSLSCPSEGLKKLFRDINSRRRDGKRTKIPDCPMESILLAILTLEYQKTQDVLPYLKRRRAACDSVGKGMHCKVQRDVVTVTHLGDSSKATRLRDHFTIDIFLSDRGEPIRVSLTREEVGRS